jgi:hypothetical protein
MSPSQYVKSACATTVRFSVAGDSSKSTGRLKLLHVLKDHRRSSVTLLGQGLDSWEGFTFAIGVAG